MDVVRQLLMDEYEILHWAKFIERFDFGKDEFELKVFFIGLTTKLLLNPLK